MTHRISVGNRYTGGVRVNHKHPVKSMKNNAASGSEVPLILIYSADPSEVAWLRDELAELEVRIHSSEQVEAVGKLAAEERPALIISSVQQQQTQPLELILQISRAQNIPVLAICDDDAPLFERVIEMGITDCIVRPTHPTILRNRARNLLRAQQWQSGLARYEKLLETSQDAIILADPDFLVTGWNRGAEQIYGWRSDEVMGTYLLKLLHPLNISDEALQNWAAEMPRQRQWSGEIVHARKDGTTIRILAAVTSIEDENGHLLGYMTINRDISEIHAAKLARQRSEQILRHLYDESPVMMLSIDAAGCISEANRRWLENTGYSSEEVLGKPLQHFLRLSQNSEEESIEALLQSLWTDGSTLSSNLALRCAAGHDIDIVLEGRSTEDPQQGRMGLLVMHDITVQRRIEDSLRSSEMELHSILKAMTELVLVLDRDGRYMRIATPQHEALVLPASELLGKRLEDVLPREIGRRLQDLIREVLDDGQSRRSEYSLELHGEQRWFSIVYSPLDATQVVAVVHEVTDRQQAQVALAESERNYRLLFESATDIILLIDIENGKIINANEQALRALGYSHSDLIGQSITLVEQMPHNLDDTIRLSVQHQSGQLILEQRYRRKDGSEFLVETSSRVVQYRGRSTILCIARDITQREQARREEQEQRLLAEALREAAAALGSTLELRELMALTLNFVMRIIPCDAANLMLIEDEYAVMKYWRGYQSIGVADEVIGNVRFNVSQVESFRWIMENQKSLLVEDTYNTEFHWQHPEGYESLRAYVGAPLIVKGEVIGFLNLDSQTAGRFEQKHSRILQAFANQAAIAIQNVRLFEATQRYAHELAERVQERTAALTEANAALQRQIEERRSIEEALEEERNLLRTLIDNMPDPIVVKNELGRLLLVNRAAQDLITQLGQEDAFEQPHYDFMPADETGWRIEEEQRVIEGGQSVIDREELLQLPDGSSRWLLSTKLPLHDARGKSIGLVGIHRDITELKQAEARLEEERNLLRTLVDTIPDLIYVKDLEHRYLLANKSMVWALGRDRLPDVLGHSDLEFLPAGQARERHEAEKPILERGQTLLNQNMEFHNASGEVAWHLVTKLPLRDAQGNVVGLIGVNRDISDIKQAEQQLEQILTSARCLIWYAIVEERADGHHWTRYITNEQAAQRLLPLNLNGHTYTQAWWESIEPADRERGQFIFNTHVRYNKMNYSHEIRCRIANGETRWLVEDVQIKQLTTGRWSLVGVCTEITERKQAEQKLKAAYDELELRVLERTKELVKANEVLTQEISERKRAEEAERAQRLLAEALRASGAVLNNTLDRDAVLDSLLESLTTVVPHDASLVLLLENNQIQIARGGGGSRNVPPIPQDVHEWPDLLEMIRSNQGMIIEDARQYEGWLPIEHSHWIRSNLSVPIRLDDAIIGFLKLYSRQAGFFKPEQVEWLQAFANQAAVAIRNARFVSQIRAHTAELNQRVLERTSELEHERAQLQAILDAMREGVVYQDLTLQPQYINRAMTDITGYNNEEWLSGSAQAGLNTESEEARIGLWHKVELALQMRGFWEGQTLLKRKNGDLFDARLVRTAVNDSEGRRVGIVTVLRDISQAKQLEEQKARFIASASHELRTPIANLKIRLHLMKRQPEKFQEHIDIAQSVIDWMQSLVEDMFDLSRFERGVIELEREPVLLQDLVKQVARFQQPEAERKDIALGWEMSEEPIQVYVDPFRFSQVISNLLNNAIHYTPADGSVIVRVYTEKQEAQETVCIAVSDTGAGIPADVVSKLFQPFYRAHNDNRGAGLGLAISQEIVTLHGGRIDVVSTPNSGSTFTVRLPMQHVQEPR